MKYEFNDLNDHFEGNPKADSGLYGQSLYKMNYPAASGRGIQPERSRDYARDQFDFIISVN